MIDDTEDLRRAMIAAARHKPLSQLKANPFTRHWTTEQLQQEFNVLGFRAPFVIVSRKSDGVKGSLEFTHSPRVYFNWVQDKP